MGQQQLLLLVLGIVIVSIAVFIGIDLFDQMLRQRHVDLLLNHGIHVATDAAAWYAKGTPFLGGGGSYSDLNEDGMNKLLVNPERVPGTFAITLASGDDLEISGVSNDYPEIGIRVVVQGEKIVDTIIAYDGSITLPSTETP